MPPKYFRRREASVYLKENFGIGSVALLAQLAHRGEGPEMQYIGRIPTYTAEALDAWIESRIGNPVRKAKTRRRRSEDTREGAAE